MILLRIAPLLLLIGHGSAFSNVVNRCEEFTGGNVNLDPKMDLPNSYKLSSTLTDWMSKTTTRVEEVYHKERRSVKVNNREGQKNQWITSGHNPTVRLNHTGPSTTCAIEKEMQPLSSPTLSRLSSDGSSIASLVESIVKLSQTQQGIYLNSTQVMSGVEGVHWVTCINGTGNDTSLQIEVIFAGSGESTFPPPVAQYDNPLMLYFRVAEFEDFSANSTAPISAISLEIETYDEVTETDERTFLIPSGVICHGWNTSVLPVVIAEPFSFLLERIDVNGTVSTAKVYHSASLATTCVCVDGVKSGDVIPFFDHAAPADGATVFIHDFGTGYQYSLSPSKCVNLSAIPAASADVSSSNEMISLKPVRDMLVNVSLPWAKYGQTTSSYSKSLDVWRAFDISTNSTYEVLMDGSRLVEIRHFKQSSPAPSSTLRLLPAPIPSALGALHRARDCFAAQSSPNNTFSLNIAKKSFADVVFSGEETVTAALSEAISQVSPIHPLRVKAFYDSRSDGTLAVFFTVAEKNNHVPAVTNSTYNYTEEVLTEVLFAKLNETISGGEWKFLVPNADKKSEDWSVVPSSLSHIPLPAPPPSPPNFEGYSGGSMFVLGLFSLILGCGIGAGGLFFITKRQRISTLAYQVFE